ncbi:MAG: hypothetical protein AB7N80_00730 [Bdellovibrionales bacterium]
MFQERFRRQIFLIILICGLSGSATAAIQDLCLWALKWGGLNARVLEAFEYNQPTYRDLISLDNTLTGNDSEPDSFTEFRKSLKAGDVVYDVGSGIAVASLQMSALHATHVYALSLIDFEPRLTAGRFSIKPTSVQLDGFIKQVGIYSWKELEILGRALGIEFPATPEFYENAFPQLSAREAIAQVARQIVDRFINLRNQQKKLGLFTPLIGTAEGALLALKAPAKLIIDIYGASFYSGHRAWLIYQYYNHLSPEGRAYVLLGSNLSTNENLREGPRDFVVTKRGEQLELFRRISQKHPNIFRIKHSFGMNPTDYLEIRKDPYVPFLPFDLIRDPSEMTLYHGNGSFVFEENFLYREP